jgi:alkanesulfonate monooxygenase SsuD/methylene tetrahydromethanopterin reductase-like flavin-dependent oxidoreductase (luciferase family)
MKFGLFGGARSPRGEGAEYGQGYRDFIDTVIEAEALGLHGVFLVEHHFSGTGQVSASLNLLSYLAARTTTIRLGTAVVVLPWHNPVLLAEQAATVDLLSGGRLDFGVGKGYRYSEFHGFCIPQAEAEARFEEAMGLIRKSWVSEQRFSHHGRLWHFDDVVVEPAPVQTPHPPLWLAAGRAESIRAAAKGGYNLLLDQMATFDVIGERLDVYRAALAEEGRDFDAMRVAVARALLVVTNGAEREAAIAMRARMLDRINADAASPDGKYVSSMMSHADTRLATEDGALIGTPDEIIARLLRLRARGVEYVLLVNAGPIESLRVFAREIMPHVA